MNQTFGGCEHVKKYWGVSHTLKVCVLVGLHPVADLGKGPRGSGPPFWWYICKRFIKEWLKWAFKSHFKGFWAPSFWNFIALDPPFQKFLDPPLAPAQCTTVANSWKHPKVDLGKRTRDLQLPYLHALVIMMCKLSLILKPCKLLPEGPFSGRMWDIHAILFANRVCDYKHYIHLARWNKKLDLANKICKRMFCKTIELLESQKPMAEHLLNTMPTSGNNEESPKWLKHCPQLKVAEYCINIFLGSWFREKPNCWSEFLATALFRDRGAGGTRAPNIF